MSRNKKRNELEYLRAENRKLKKRLNGAHKRNKQYEYVVDIPEDNDLEEYFEETNVLEVRCVNCKSLLDPVDLGKRWLFNCSNCGTRKTRGKS